MTTIVIVAHVFPELDEFGVWVEREEPECSWCSNTMEIVETWDEGERDTYSPVEMWECPRCHYMDEYVAYQYGDFFVEMTRQEFEDYEAGERMRNYLHRRYKHIPNSIADYWE